jgi:hypothetical protein
MPTMHILRPSRVITVTVNYRPEHGCEFGSCYRPADLMIDIHPAAESGPRGYCVDHWGQIRPRFLNRKDKIQYGEWAPQVIIERLACARQGDRHRAGIYWYLA